MQYEEDDIITTSFKIVIINFRLNQRCHQIKDDKLVKIGRKLSSSLSDPVLGLNILQG